MPYDKKTQAEILSTETSSNENMPYTRLEITNNLLETMVNYYMKNLLELFLILLVLMVNLR